MNKIKKDDKVFFPHLNGLRFIAFLLVFLQHGFYNLFKKYEGASAITDKAISLFFLGGGTGVQIFFVLSGFLITYLILKEIEKTGRINLGFFYMRRTLRIWPLYFVTLIFGFIIYPFLKSMIGIHSDLCSRPWYYFSFLANFDTIHIAETCPGKDAMTQGIVWSVSIEEQFYLFWPLLFFISRRLVWLPFLIVILVSTLFKVTNMSNHPVLYFHTLSVISDLAIGGMLAYLSLYASGFRNFFIEQSREVIIGIYLLIMGFQLFGGTYINLPGSVIASRYITDIFWGYIILEQNFSKNSFYKLGNFKTCTYWGKYTYGLYMLHPVGILIADVVIKFFHWPDSHEGILAIRGFSSFLLSLILAKVSFHYLEEPFLKLKERFTIVKSKTEKSNLRSLEVII